MPIRLLSTSLTLAVATTLSLFLASGQAAQEPAGDTPKEPSTTTAKDAPRTDAPASDSSAADKEKAKDTAKAKTRPKLEKATFGTGCFWCGEAVFERLKGVHGVVSGYSGGQVPNPTYEMVSTGMTGHAEAFQVTYDPSVVTYETLLKYFWHSHDPTTPNQQGPDFGTQYRSVIFYHTEAQKTAAQKSFQQLADQGYTVTAIVTQLVPYETFYPAEAYHQDYYRRHRGAEYCQMWIEPKLRKLKLIK